MRRQSWVRAQRQLCAIPKPTARRCVKFSSGDLFNVLLSGTQITRAVNCISAVLFQCFHQRTKDRGELNTCLQGLWREWEAELLSAKSKSQQFIWKLWFSPKNPCKFYTPDLNILIFVSICTFLHIFKCIYDPRRWPWFREPLAYHCKPLVHCRRKEATDGWQRTQVLIVLLHLYL